MGRLWDNSFGLSVGDDLLRQRVRAEGVAAIPQSIRTEECFFDQTINNAFDHPPRPTDSRIRQIEQDAFAVRTIHGTSNFCATILLNPENRQIGKKRRHLAK
jgi:hypothetical protein